MKILILSSGRAGSTSLAKAFYEGFDNAFYISEIFYSLEKPFVSNNLELQNHLKKISNIKNTHVICKDLIHDPLVNNDLKFNKFFENIPISNGVGLPSLKYISYKFLVEYFLKYIQNFDRIVLLYRKDIKKCAESWAYIKKYGFKYQNHVKNVGKYKYDNSLSIKDEVKDLKKYNKALNEISKKIKIPLTSYEDLFSGNLNYLQYFLDIHQIEIEDFSQFNYWLNPKNRHRQD